MKNDILLADVTTIKREMHSHSERHLYEKDGEKRSLIYILNELNSIKQQVDDYLHKAVN